MPIAGGYRLNHQSITHAVHPRGGFFNHKDSML